MNRLLIKDIIKLLIIMGACLSQSAVIISLNIAQAY
jgi:hypothetical protein